MIRFDEQKKLFELIGKECNREIDAIVIGGSAMLFYSFSKTETKDIDIVLFSEGDRKYFMGVLKKIGFKAEILNNNENEPCKLVFKDYIVDVFAKSVFKLKISKGILERIEEKIEFGKLTVSIISPEDIILSKSMTDRIGDREDAVSIIKETNVKWDIVMNECIWQSENGDARFCMYLYDFLDYLVHDFGISIPKPIAKQIRKMHRDFLDNIKKG